MPKYRVCFRINSEFEDHFYFDYVPTKMILDEKLVRNKINAQMIHGHLFNRFYEQCQDFLTNLEDSAWEYYFNGATHVYAGIIDVEPFIFEN